MTRSFLPPSLVLLVPLASFGGCRAAEVRLDTAENVGDTDPGTGVSGDLAVNPASIELPLVFVGQPLTAEVTLTNLGSGAISSSLTFVGGWSTSYTLDAYTSSLLAGDSSTHTVKLTPTTWGDHSVGLVIDSDTGVHIEVPIRATVQEDGDGDGSGSLRSGGDDCDDQDASIHPGVTEIWYDGIDSDCAGDDDNDQDADGVCGAAGGGEDCNDEDGTINPNLTETWYDGDDNDCAGDDDYDQDADGFVPDEYFGLLTDGVARSGRLPGGDCDDTNAAFRPEVFDVWYDGVDSDCALNDDYDRDDDGHASNAYAGDDCDDINPTTYPGAVDAWYDGVDSDCLGDDDHDQDLDGVDYPADCDDTDPATTGPVPETMNGVDDDCDGATDDFEIGAVATGAMYGYATSMALGDHGNLALAADVTGDGAVDLLIGARATESGYVWVVDGATASAANGEVREFETAVYTGESAYYAISSLNGPWADQDGDGTTDFTFGGFYQSTYYPYGRSYLVPGGSRVTGSVTADAAGARFSSDDDYDSPSQSAIGDVDGDGLGDVVIGSDYDEGSESAAGSIAIFLGGSLSGDLNLADADDLIYGTLYDYLGCSLTSADTDNDGYDDIIAGASGYDGSSSAIGAVFIVRGSGLATWGAAVEDAASGSVVGNARSLALGSDTLPHPGDLDGDGNLDLVVTSEDHGSAWVFMNAGTIGTGTSVFDATHTVSGNAGDMGSMVVLDSDLDNDGADDLVVGADGDDTNGNNSGTVYIFRDESTWAVALTAADASATFYGASGEGYLGSGGAGGLDMDGDDIEDLVIGGFSNDERYPGGGVVYVVPGW